MYAMNEVSPVSLPPPRESYLTFMIGGESYCLPFLRIAEVRTLRNSAPVLAAPAFEHGFVMLHGRSIPLVDLRVRFGSAAHFNSETRIVVAWISRARRPDTSIALMVDRVENLVPIDSTTVDAASCAGFMIAEGFIRGIASLNGTATALLDLEELIDPTIEQLQQR